MELFSCPADIVTNDPVIRGLELLYPPVENRTQPTVDTRNGMSAEFWIMESVAKKMNEIKQVLLAMNGKIQNLSTTVRENGLKIEYINDNILTLNQRFDKLANDKV